MAVLRGVARLVAEHGGDALLPFADGVARFDHARGALGLEDALGLRARPGQRSWAAEEARIERDRILCRISETWFAGEPSASAQADAIVAALARYAATQWRRDREFLDPSTAAVGRLEADLFALLRVGAPPEARTIRRALAAGHETLSFRG